MGIWGDDVMLHPYTGIDLASIWDELEYKHYTLQSPNTKLPLHVFEAQPVVGKRITILNLQLDDDDDVLSVVITGHTWHHPTSTKGPPRIRSGSFLVEVRKIACSGTLIFIVL